MTDVPHLRTWSAVDGFPLAEQVREAADRAARAPYPPLMIGPAHAALVRAHVGKGEHEDITVEDLTTYTMSTMRSHD